MGPAVYVLGSLVCLLCSILLLRRYSQVRQRLLLWSGVCFAGLTVSNLLVFVDLVVIPETDLYIYRLVVGAVAMLFLLYGLIWESK
jgi:Family of unknown function (DUF5985)